MPEEANPMQVARPSHKERLPWRRMWRRDWRDPEEKFTFAVCAVALVIVIAIAKVWFE